MTSDNQKTSEYVVEQILPAVRRGDMVILVDDERRANTVEGLAASLRSAGTGSMAPLWERLGQVTAPVLCLAGADDAKFCALGEQLAAALPHGEFVSVPDAGHAAHLEQPDEVAAQVTGFLDRD